MAVPADLKVSRIVLATVRACHVLRFRCGDLRLDLRDNSSCPFVVSFIDDADFGIQVRGQLPKGTLQEPISNNCFDPLLTEAMPDELGFLKTPREIDGKHSLTVSRSS